MLCFVADFSLIIAFCYVMFHFQLKRLRFSIDLCQQQDWPSSLPSISQMCIINTNQHQNSFVLAPESLSPQLLFSAIKYILRFKEGIFALQLYRVSVLRFPPRRPSSTAAVKAVVYVEKTLWLEKLTQVTVVFASSSPCITAHALSLAYHKRMSSVTSKITQYLAETAESRSSAVFIRSKDTRRNPRNSQKTEDPSRTRLVSFAAVMKSCFDGTGWIHGFAETCSFSGRKCSRLLWKNSLRSFFLAFEDSTAVWWFCSESHLWSWILNNDWKSDIPSASGRDEIFAKSSRHDASRQSTQLWNL